MYVKTSWRQVHDQLADSWLPVQYLLIRASSFFVKYILFTYLSTLRTLIWCFAGLAGGMDWLQPGGFGLENRFWGVESNITASF